MHLESKEVIHGTDDDVDACRAARLCPQVVLEICSKTQSAWTNCFRGNINPIWFQLSFQSKHECFSPLLWPSQSSCKNRNWSQVNSSSAITFSSKKIKLGHLRLVIKHKWQLIFNAITESVCLSSNSVRIINKMYYSTYHQI